jgi:hypothetical protein
MDEPFGPMRVVAHVLNPAGQTIRKIDFPTPVTGSAEPLASPTATPPEDTQTDLYDELIALEKRAIEAPAELQIAPTTLAKPFMIAHQCTLTVFAEDTLFIVRQKLALATGIPLYRLHIWSGKSPPHSSTDEPIDEFYAILLNGITQHEFDSRDLFSAPGRDSTATRDLLFGCPIDYTLNRAQSGIRIETAETVTLAGAFFGGGRQGTLWCADLHSFLAPHAEAIAAASESQLRILYYGFVQKYWPTITWEVFTMILRGQESQMRESLPFMVVNAEQLTEHTKQTAELNRVGSMKRAKAIDAAFRLAITFTEVTSIMTQTKIDVMRLFNAITTSNSIPMTVLLPTQNTQMIRKTFPAAKAFDHTARLKTPAEFKKGVVIVLWVDLTKFLGVMSGEHAIFVNIQANGTLSVLTKWREDYNVTFAKHFAILMHFINPFIESLNSHAALFMSGRFELFDPVRTHFKLLNVSLYWPRIITPTVFKDVRARIKSYVGAGVFEPNRFTNFQTEVICYDFNAAGTSVAPFFIDYLVPSEHFNYYSWMWNLAVSRRWFSIYHGFQTKIVHRSTDVRIEINNINQAGLSVFRHYISGILASTGAEAEAVTIVNFKKPINKLNYTDPVLFKFMKEQQSGKRLIYSVMCQGPKQPIPYSPEEVAALPATTQRKLTKYWNFTHNRPAYYLCPNSQYPHLAFQTGIHSEGYCIPCCQKLSQVDQPFYQACLEHDPKGAIVERETKTNRHVLHFSRYALDIGRIGECIPMERVLATSGSRDTSTTYLVGIPQHDRFKGPCGMLYSVAFIVGEEPTAFVRRVIRAQRDIDLIRDLFNVFVKPSGAVNMRTPEELQTIWIESAWTIYGINIVVIDCFRNLIRTQLGYHRNNGIVLEKPNKIYEPYVGLDLGAVPVSGTTPLSWKLATQRTFEFARLKSILTVPILGNRINYGRIPETRIAALVIGDRTFGFLFSMSHAAEKGTIYLPSDYTRDDGTGTVAAPEVVSDVPFDRLPFKAFNAYATEANITLTRIIKAGTNSTTLNIVALDALNRMYFFHATEAELHAVGHSITDDWHYDVNEILHALYHPVSSETLEAADHDERAFFERIESSASVEMEHQMAYRHFTYVFILVLNKFRNMELRERIMAEMKGAKNFAHLGLSRADAATLHGMAARYYRKTIAAKNWDAVARILRAQKFEFDDVFLARLKTLPREALKERVMGMMRPYVRVAGGTFNDLTHGDAISFDLEHYAKAPLAIIVAPDETAGSPEDLSQPAAARFFDLLVRDIQNPLMTHYFSIEVFEHLFESMHTTNDLTRFVTKPGEKIEFMGNVFEEELDEETSENA